MPPGRWWWRRRHSLLSRATGKVSAWKWNHLRRSGLSSRNRDTQLFEFLPGLSNFALERDAQFLGARQIAALAHLLQVTRQPAGAGGTQVGEGSLERMRDLRHLGRIFGSDGGAKALDLLRGVPAENSHELGE